MLYNVSLIKSLNKINIKYISRAIISIIFHLHKKCCIEETNKETLGGCKM